MPQKVLACYTRGRWAWHVAAALVTVALVLSGFDWWFFKEVHSVVPHWLIWVAGIGGFFAPVIVPVGLYWVGEWRKNARILRAGVVVAQANIIAYLITNFYKAFTGRAQPEFLTNFNGAEITHSFHFGFLQNGVFFGWPSSHAALAVAGSTALFLAWPNRTVRIAAVVWAAVVCVGAAVGFHWFSDVVAGVIIGIIAGVAVWQDIK